MENNLSIKEKIENIRNLEGNSFEFNEKEIENEYINSQKEKHSIATKILSIFGGFLATLAFIGFIYISGLYDSEVGLVITGFIFIGAAICLNIVHNKLIIDTLSVSTFVIGLCLIAYGLSVFEVRDYIISVTFIIISLFAIGITKNFILSFISVLTINVCFIYLIIDNDFYSLFHVYNAILLFLLTYLFLHEAKLLADKIFPSKLYNPIRIGLMISLISGLVFVGKWDIYDFGIMEIWATSIISIPLTIYVISIISKIIGITKTKSLYIIYCSSIMFLLPTAMSPAISASLLIILLSFLVNYKTGLVIGIISFIYFISQYYYDLNFTLLTKSLLLFVSGIIFLILFIVTHKKLGQNEKV